MKLKDITAMNLFWIIFLAVASADTFKRVADVILESGIIELFFKVIGL